jgi:hypothetical protein
VNNLDEKYKHKNALIKIIFQPGFSGFFWHCACIFDISTTKAKPMIRKRIS